MSSKAKSRKNSPNDKVFKISSPQPIHVTKPISKVYVNLKELPKNPTPPPSLLNASRQSHKFGPLRSHSSPEPSTDLEPQLPHPHPSAIRAALRIDSPDQVSPVDTKDGFEEVQLAQEDSRASHHSTEAPSSFIKEVDDKISSDFEVTPLDSPNVDSGNPLEGPEVKRNLSLSSRSGQYRAHRQTEDLLNGITPGPYSTMTLPLDEEPVKRYSFDSEKEINDMVERSGTQRLRDAAFYLLTIITSAVAIAALVIAVLAVAQNKSFKVTSNTIILESAIVASTTDSHLLGMTVVETQHTDLLHTTSTSTHDWSTTSRLTTASQA
jgi:hypothetical protein